MTAGRSPKAGGNGPVVVVLDEFQDGAGAGGGPELLAAAGGIRAALGGRVVAITFGPKPPADASAAHQYGADEAVAGVAPWLTEPGSEAVVAAVAELCTSPRPAVILMSHGARSWEVAPRLAVRLGAGLVTDCVSLSVRPSDGALVGTRPCFGGKALSEWRLRGTSVVTIRRGSFVPGAPDPGRSGQVAVVELGTGPEIRTRTVARTRAADGELRLEDADVVVGVGRGVGTREEFQNYFVDGLARAIGAVCGGSRGAVDQGIVPPELQIGLTGRVVSPKLYIAVGLSGSPQHMAGCSGARRIVAINKDPQAPIFGYAHHGVVGDYRAVVPSLTARLEELAAT